jgi:hypothetical protein
MLKTAMPHWQSLWHNTNAKMAEIPPLQVVLILFWIENVLNFNLDL